MAAAETVKDPHHELSSLWSVHSEHDGQPTMRAWTKSEADAKAELEKIKASDDDADKGEYWVMQLTMGDVNNFKASGFIPADA